jgi:hypothetical protein
LPLVLLHRAGAAQFLELARALERMGGPKHIVTKSANRAQDTMSNSCSIWKYHWAVVPSRCRAAIHTFSSSMVWCPRKKISQRFSQGSGCDSPSNLGKESFGGRDRQTLSLSYPGSMPDRATLPYQTSLLG